MDWKLLVNSLCSTILIDDRRMFGFFRAKYAPGVRHQCGDEFVVVDAIWDEIKLVKNIKKIAEFGHQRFCY